MPIQLETPPPGFYDLVRQTLSRLSGSGGAADTITNVPDPTKLNSALPHRVFLLGADDIVKGRNLDQARFSGWRLLLQYGSRTTGAIEFTADPKGRNLRFSSLDAGPFALGTRQMVAGAEASDAVKQGSYQLRVVKAPSVYVMAVWLKDLVGKNDIVHPLADSSEAGVPRIGGGLPLSATDFMKELRAPATVALGADTRPEAAGRPAPPPPRQSGRAATGALGSDTQPQATGRPAPPRRSGPGR
jgi:hypothetical protein